MRRNSVLLTVQVVCPGLLLVLALAACGGSSSGGSSTGSGCVSNCGSTGGGETGPFAASVNYAVGTNPVALVVADFNGDDKPDLAVANQSSSDVSILIGNGDGTFQKAANYGLGKTPSFLATGDFNADHRLDLAVAEGGGNKSVSILIGNGDGTFQPAVSYNAGGDADYVASADFNGDGKPDLLISSTGGISILMGNGNGTFQNAVLTSTSGTTPFVALGDFNGDGDIDVATATGGTSGESDFGNLIVLLGNGNGTFQTQVLPKLRFWPKVLIAADLNGDGKIDLAAVVRENIFGSDIRVFLGNGDGTFGDPAQVRGEFASLVMVGDVNNDSKPDLLGLEYIDPDNSPMEIQWMLGNGDGTFQNAVFRPCTQSSGCVELSSKPSWLAVADLNQDGLHDLVVTNPNDNSISVFKGVP